MTEDRYTEWLGDYVDGTLEASDIQLLEAHFSNCEACRTAAEDLRHIKEQAADLPRLIPPEDVWKRISTSLRHQNPQMARPSVKSWLWSNRWAVAASVLMVVSSFSAGVLWNRSTAEPPSGDTGELVNWVASELVLAEQHYENAIGGLEKIVEKEKQEGTLEPQVMAVLNDNLTLIENAIGESRAATQEQPESRIAQESLLQALRSKLSLLQNTILLINEVRKGQGETAYDLMNKIDDTPGTSNPIGP
jgi:hypothetical protein